MPESCIIGGAVLAVQTFDQKGANMIGAVIEKTVRRISPDRGKAKLEKAVAELRTLTESLAKEGQFLSDAIALFQKHLQRVNAVENAVAAALAAKDIAKVDAALNEPRITPEFIRCQLAALGQHEIYKTPYHVFLSEHQSTKTLMVTVAKLRLQ